MGTNQNQQYQYDRGLSRTMKMPAIRIPVAHEERENRDVKEVLPGVLVVRSNTPRPHSFESMFPPEGQSQSGQQSETAPLPAFPSKAPSAPPLPEELSEEEEEELPATVVPISSSGALKQVAEDPQEFLWLFEYGLEMDTAILNSPERLDGLALLYGPAVLKGYSIMFGSAAYDGRSAAGKTIVTIAPRSEPEAEVWGVLYRVPRRVAESNEHQLPLLDTVHGAGTHDALFKRMQIVVHETYRNREIACVTYLVSDAMRQRLRLFSWQQGGDQTALAQRLATIARKQKLPEKYLSIYPSTTPFPFHTPPTDTDPVGSAFRSVQDVEQAVLPLSNMPDTEPLPVVKGKGSEQLAADTKAETPETAQEPQTNRWLIVFALYLAIVLLAVLVVAMLQGFGNGDLTNGFRPLGVPVLVLVYGLLGGCVSSLITLGRYRVVNPPPYVIITWFTRPYIGSVLATLTYLLFTSGFFIITDDSVRHHTLFLFVGALAGLCEGWLFFRKSQTLVP
ncbi:MAG TPA: gamma-glutamylcyclotransferase family protein [Ktedonosporobacter sp.]|nr:gamma-glutamylcyclotransferase family protein [Ktedonosporobacter sp.]